MLWIQFQELFISECLLTNFSSATFLPCVKHSHALQLPLLKLKNVIMRERESNPSAFGRTRHTCLDSLGTERAFPCTAGRGKAEALPGTGKGLPQSCWSGAVRGKHGALAWDSWLIFLFTCQSSSSGSSKLRLEWPRLYPKPGTWQTPSDLHYQTQIFGKLNCSGSKVSSP